MRNVSNNFRSQKKNDGRLTKYRLAEPSLPTRLPVLQTMMLFMFMDYYNFDGFTQGVVWTVAALYWIGCVAALIAYAGRKEVWIEDLIGEKRENDI